MTLLAIGSGLLAGFFLWGLAEYLLHRFAMHEHYVHASWSFSKMHLLSWAGMLLVGFVTWMPLGWAIAGSAFGVSVALGWSIGYFFYELNHAAAHLWAPRGAYGSWLRKHHFHHHFGHPMANHGVSWPLWDLVFGTLERPEQVRVPRRMVSAWMVDAEGELEAAYRDDYVLVGGPSVDERDASLDRARAFASVAPAD